MRRWMVFCLLVVACASPTSVPPSSALPQLSTDADQVRDLSSAEELFAIMAAQGDRPNLLLVLSPT